MKEAEDFADMIREHGHGDTNREMTRALHDVLLACEETRSEGTITLVLKCSVNKEKGIAEVATKMTVKTPMPELTPATYFMGKADEELPLHNENPRQTALPLRTMPPIPFNNRDKGD